jgi:hypothetical protein
MFVGEAWSLPASASCSKLGCLLMGTKTIVCGWGLEPTS